MNAKESKVDCNCGVGDTIRHDPAVNAKVILQSSSYVAIAQLRCEFDNGVLTISGELPSFYLKQLAQTLIRNIEGIQRIVNCVEVSERRRTTSG